MKTNVRHTSYCGTPPSYWAQATHNSGLRTAALLSPGPLHRIYATQALQTRAAWHSVIPPGGALLHLPSGFFHSQASSLTNLFSKLCVTIIPASWQAESVPHWGPAVEVGDNGEREKMIPPHS